MTTQEPAPYAETVLAGLKPFQRRTARYAFHRLYEAPDSTQRFLIADEVGLGKTLVAAGVTALAIDHLRTAETPRIDIIYICSNQAIARQNVERIKQRLKIETKALAERITLLPYTLQSLDQPVNLVALTPSTSFSAAHAEGVVKERIILFRMLTDVWGNLGRSARQVFRGTLRSVRRFRQYEEWIPRQPIDPGILQRFRDAVGGPGSPLHREFISVRDSLAYRDTPEARARRRAFIARMRRILADACLLALQPDFVILDEFQRFSALLDEETPSGELARQLFEYEDEHTSVRTMLLSATPYKMYTLSGEADDDHYRDFLRTVRFLGAKSCLPDVQGARDRRKTPRIAPRHGRSPLAAMAVRGAESCRSGEHMATILAHIKIKEGKEARFEELEGELWRDTHANEKNVARYEFWRGAEKGSYYGLLSFNSYNGFIEHQASPHHEDSGLGEVIEGIRLEWIDPVPSASDLATTDTEPLFEGANDLQKQYHANFQPDVQDWWRALRAGA